MFAFMNETFAKYEKNFFNLSIKSLEGNDIELSKYKKKIDKKVEVLCLKKWKKNFEKQKK